MIVMQYIRYRRLTQVVAGERLCIFLIAETNILKADEDEELAAEKKKNLEILGSLLNVNLEHPKLTKKATSAKKFKYELSVINEEGILGRLSFCPCFTTKFSTKLIRESVSFSVVCI